MVTGGKNERDRTAPTAVVAVLLATARVRTVAGSGASIVVVAVRRLSRADFESSEAGRVMGKDRHQRQRDGL